MNDTDIDRLNISIGMPTALIRPVQPTEKTREILTRWPSLITPHDTLSHAVTFISTLEYAAESLEQNNQ